MVEVVFPLTDVVEDLLREDFVEETFKGVIEEEPVRAELLEEALCTKANLACAFTADTWV